MVTFFVSLYSVGRYACGWQAWAGAFLILAGVVWRVLVDGSISVLNDWVSSVPMVGGPWGAGLAIRLRRQRERVLELATLVVPGHAAPFRPDASTVL